MPSDPKTVAIAFDLNFRQAAEVFSGVSNYTRTNRLDWRLIPLNYGFEAQLMELAASKKLSGALGTFISDTWVGGLSEQGVKAVNLFNFSKIKRIPTVGLDDCAMGLAAANHLKMQGARSFAFHGGDRAYYNQLRNHGFSKACGDQIFVEIDPGPPIASEIDILSALPKPVGIFCSSDRLARQLVLAAQRIGLSCPKDLLLVGVGAEPSESIFAGVGISSFKLPATTVGSKAAATLQALFDGDGDQASTLLKPSGLLIRESTLSSSHARNAQRAINLIDQQLANPALDVALIAQTVGISRRSLEITFKEHSGQSPYRFLTKKRIELAQKLLSTTKHPIMEIGSRCGYPEPHHFSAWFKTQTGSAPRTYRENNPSV